MYIHYIYTPYRGWKNILKRKIFYCSYIEPFVKDDIPRENKKKIIKIILNGSILLSVFQYISNIESLVPRIFKQ